MKLYLVRHGQTDWNIGKLAQGQTDIPLNATGIAQARELAAKIRDYHFDYCYSSPLSRARQTAEILVEHRNLPIIDDDRLMERAFGKYEGTSGPDMVKNNPGFDSLKAKITTYDIEPLRHTFDRAESFLAMLREKHQDNDVILIVGHGTLLKCMHFAIVGYDDDLDFWSWHLHNCEFSEHELNK